MINVCRTQKWQNLFMMFTNWQLWIINLTAITGTILVMNPEYNQKNALNLHALHHFFYTFTMLGAPLITCVYWGLIFKKHKGEMWENTKEWHGRVLSDAERLDFYEQKLLHSKMVHSLPFCCSILLMLINDAVLIKEQNVKLLVLAVFYGFINWYSVKYHRDGKPIYWFMPWKDYWTVINYSAICLVFDGVFYFVAKLDERITGRSSS